MRGGDKLKNENRLKVMATDGAYNAGD